MQNDIDCLTVVISLSQLPASCLLQSVLCCHLQLCSKLAVHFSLLRSFYQKIMAVFMMIKADGEYFSFMLIEVLLFT